MTTQDTQSIGLASRALLPDLEYDNNLFNYTRGRFVCNEAYEMSQRHIRFNVNELARLAAEAVGAKSCVSVYKFPEGMYNKAMLLTMDNGTEVVAKVPNPNAGKSHFTTASEVATMDFVRNVLGTPAPKVFAWSSRAMDNPVGAEYIIMETVQGIELEQFWPSMNIADKLTLLKTIAGFQKDWMSISFKKFGSLYYVKDLAEGAGNGPLYTDANGVDVTSAKFAIGPSTGRDMTDDRRATIEFNRGPWDTLEEYHSAIGQREIACIGQLPRLPKSLITLRGPGMYQPTREKKLKALDCYLKLIKFLLPTDQSIASSHLCHADLHLANILVNSCKPTEIVGLIDWQSTELSPLYCHARRPHIMDYVVERLDENSRRHALFMQQSLCASYDNHTFLQNPRLFAAFEFQRTMSHQLLMAAQGLLVDGEAGYLWQVAALEAAWDTRPGFQNLAFPLSFTVEERQDMEADVKGALLGAQVMSSIREHIGELVSEKGIVRVDLYQDALRALEHMKKQIIEAFATNEQEREAWQKEWPFGT